MKKCKLGEILIDVKRGVSLSGKFYAEEGDLVRLTLGNFNYPNGGFKENTSKTDIFFTGEIRKEFIMKKGDIITPLTEQVTGLLGETARIPEDNKYIQSGDIALVIPNEKLLDKSYAYYLVSSPSVKKQLAVVAQQTKIRHTSPDKIKSCEVWIPELNYQRKAGKLLDSINNQIELNNKINNELEQLSKTIYDYWFLQFDFPDENGKPYKSSGGKMVWNEILKREIPEGWEVQNLKNNNLTNIVIPGIQKFNSNKIYLATADVNKNNIVGGNIVTFENRESRANMQPIRNSIWFAKMKNSMKHIFVGDYADSLLNKYIFSTGFLGLMCQNDYSYEYICSFINTEYFETFKDKIAHGATQEAVNNDDIKFIPMIIPSKKVLLKYHETTKNIFKQIYLKNLENKELKSLRDFLLPLLMNGQVTFKE